MTDELNLQIKTRYLAGTGLPGIARAIGRSQCLVRGRLLKAGVEMRKAGNPKTERPERRVCQIALDVAVCRYLAGESAKRIGDTGGISKPTLLRELRRLGASIRLQGIGNEDGIIAAYNAGLSVNKIEKQIGCTKRRAANVLKAAGILFRERTREKTALSRTLACKRRNDRVAIATPPWADKREIKSIYSECRRISAETGRKHHVDHFYPLRNELVCGLHTPANLVIVTERENVAKKNKIEKIHLEWKYFA